jgi:hypothetical protein
VHGTVLFQSNVDCLISNCMGYSLFINENIISLRQVSDCTMWHTNFEQKALLNDNTCAIHCEQVSSGDVVVVLLAVVVEATAS